MRSSRTSWFGFAIVGAVALAGCGADASYVYRPETATAVVDGRPVTVVAIPPERPTGEVHVQSAGMTRASPDGRHDIPALMVRMVVDNEGDPAAWSFDTRAATIQIPGEGEGHVMFANADVATLPVVTIDQHTRRTIDLYFALPAAIRGDADLPVFDVVWSVTTPARTISQRTRFQRLLVDAEPTTQIVLLAGWGPVWWWDPAFPPPRFVHPPRWYPPPRPHGRVIVRDHR